MTIESFAEVIEATGYSLQEPASYLYTRFYIFENEYSVFTSKQLTTADNILSSSLYTYFKEYHMYEMDGFTVDEDSTYEASYETSAFTLSLGVGEMTVATYYEWDIRDDGTWVYKCPEGSTQMTSNTEGGAGSCAALDDDGNWVDVALETELTTQTINRYQTLAWAADTAPTYTADSEDENIYSLTYHEDEAAGLKDKLGSGDIGSPYDAISSFFSSSAETLFNTMNISRFNFKKTDAPVVKNTNLSAIGTVAMGSAITPGSSTDQFGSTTLDIYS